jgi:hypothetical protein
MEVGSTGSSHTQQGRWSVVVALDGNFQVVLAAREAQPVQGCLGAPNADLEQLRRPA